METSDFITYGLAGITGTILSLWCFVVLHMPAVIRSGIQTRDEIDNDGRVIRYIDAALHPEHVATSTSDETSPDAEKYEEGISHIIHEGELNEVGTMHSYTMLSSNLWLMPFSIGRSRNEKDRTVTAFIDDTARIQPDFICIQEAWGAYSFIQNRVTRSLNDLGYITYTPPTPGFMTGRVLDSGLVVAVKASVGAIEAARFTPFPWSTLPYPDAWSYKGAAVIRVRLQTGGRLTLVNTHLAASYHVNDEFGRRHRAKQMDLLIKSITESDMEEAGLYGTSHTLSPVVLGGDFNQPGIAEMIRVLPEYRDANEVQVESTHHAANVLTSEVETSSSNTRHAGNRAQITRHTQVVSEAQDHVVGARGAKIYATVPRELIDRNSHDSEETTLSDHAMLVSNVLIPYVN